MISSTKEPLTGTRRYCIHQTLIYLSCLYKTHCFKRLFTDSKTYIHPLLLRNTIRHTHKHRVWLICCLVTTSLSRSLFHRPERLFVHHSPAYSQSSMMDIDWSTDLNITLKKSCWLADPPLRKTNIDRCINSPMQTKPAPTTIFFLFRCGTYSEINAYNNALINTFLRL